MSGVGIGRYTPAPIFKKLKIKRLVRQRISEPFLGYEIGF